MSLFTKSKAPRSEVMVPAGSGIIDVVNNFMWTTSNNRKEIPVAAITEYQINSGQLLAGLYYYSRQVYDTASEIPSQGINVLQGGPAAQNPYEFMYFATPTGFNYLMPWLGSEKFSRTNTFSLEAQGSGITEIGKMALAFPDKLGKGDQKLGFNFPTFRKLAEFSTGVGTGFNLAQTATSKLITGNLGLNSSQSWTGSSGQGYTITFDLLNTFGSTSDIIKNRELAYLLAYQNSPFRRNFAVIDPVCIYQLSIPDVVHFPACYISSLNISNVGNTRLLNIDGENRTIPEAYRFNLSFTPLVEESRNIFSGVQNASEKVQAISTDTAFNALQSGGKALLEGAQKLFTE